MSIKLKERFAPLFFIVKKQYFYLTLSYKKPIISHYEMSEGTHMKISFKIVILVLCSLFALIVTNTFSLYQLKEANGRFNFINININPSIKMLYEINRDFDSVRMNTYKLFLSNNEQDKKDTISVIEQKQKNIQKNLDLYMSSMIADSHDKELLMKEQEDIQNYYSFREKMVTLAQSDLASASTQLMNQGKKLGAVATKDLEEHIAYNELLFKNLSKANDSAYSQSFSLILTIVALFILTICMISFVIYKQIKNKLTSLNTTMLSIQENLDFTQRVEIISQDEIGETALAFNQLMTQLQHNFKQFKDSAQNILTTSSFLNTTALSLKEDSLLQSEAASSIAATTEEMTVSINMVSEQAHNANQLTKQSSNYAQNSVNFMKSTIEDVKNINQVIQVSSSSIKELEKQSSDIVTILNVIKDIAGQTNLLALNAAIEAARAGEIGRGFAVVADEVRKLADNTANSVSEIDQTINKIRQTSMQSVKEMDELNQKVQDSVKRANEAEQIIGQIVSSTHNTLGSVEEISHAMHEQSVASNDIAIRVEKIAQMSEGASQKAQETFKNVENLNVQATAQIKILEQYKF